MQTEQTTKTAPPGAHLGFVPTPRRRGPSRNSRRQFAKKRLQKVAFLFLLVGASLGMGYVVSQYEPSVQVAE